MPKAQATSRPRSQWSIALPKTYDRTVDNETGRPERTAVRQSIGPHTARLFERILAYKPHPEMGYRSCLGLIRLAGQYSSSGMEAAAGVPSPRRVQFPRHDRARKRAEPYRLNRGLSAGG